MCYVQKYFYCFLCQLLVMFQTWCFLFLFPLLDLWPNKLILRQPTLLWAWAPRFSHNSFSNRQENKWRKLSIFFSFHFFFHVWNYGPTPPELASPLDRAESFGISALVCWLRMLVWSLNDLLQTPNSAFFHLFTLEGKTWRAWFFHVVSKGETGLEGKSVCANCYSVCGFLLSNFYSGVCGF